MSETTPTPETEDTEGHMRAFNDGTPPPADEGDDVEGHRYSPANTDEKAAGSGEGDDVEGHLRSF